MSVDLAAPGIERLDVDAIDAGQLPRRDEFIHLAHRLLHLDDLEVDERVLVAARLLQIDEAADVGVGLLVVRIDADQLVGLRPHPVQAEIDRAQPGIQDVLRRSSFEQGGVGADLAAQALACGNSRSYRTAAGAAAARPRCAAWSPAPRAPSRSTIALEELEVHVALLAHLFLAARRAHDAAQSCRCWSTRCRGGRAAAPASSAPSRTPVYLTGRSIRLRRQRVACSSLLQKARMSVGLLGRWPIGRLVHLLCVHLRFTVHSHA